MTRTERGRLSAVLLAAVIAVASGFFEMPREGEAALHAARISTAVTGDELAHTVERDEHSQPIALWGANQAIAAIASKIAWKRAASAGRKPR